ncbi:MAG: heparinase II/III-family protein, partial [Pseudomonadota bacterium]
CGQDCALRALTLATTLLAPPGPAMRALLDAHARRIEATRFYALAQDNNHAVSEAAGLLACGLVLGDARRERRGAAALIRAARRLIAPCGAFAQPSARYHRLLLDTLAVTTTLWRRHRGPEADLALRPRAAAATAWLARIMDPETGRLPRLGPEDPSCFADLAGTGPDDARASLARAQAVFGILPQPASIWLSEGWRGWQAGRLRAILRTGVPHRFRPAHADLLHLDLWVGSLNLLRDAGSGSYNPPAGAAWDGVNLAAARAHNLITFDDAEPMPRVTRFLFARWPRTRLLPEGAETRDSSGMTHAREVTLCPHALRVTDRIRGPFRRATLRWRLAPGAWRLDGDAALGCGARIAISADAPMKLRLVQGWESPAYGSLAPVPVLEAEVAAPATRLETLVDIAQ